MTIKYTIEPRQIGETIIHLCIPDARMIREEYQVQKGLDSSVAFPFWSQLWPAGIALSIFLEEHREYIIGKKVLEIGAGVGLPSLYASKYAKEVRATDYLPEVVDCLNASAIQNQLSNFSCGLLDWNTITDIPEADTLLISDINYDPHSFDAILSMLEKFISQGTVILLATPQRLMAKYFMNKLEENCLFKEVIDVEKERVHVPISVWVLGMTSAGMSSRRMSSGEGNTQKP